MYCPAKSNGIIQIAEENQIIPIFCSLFQRKPPMAHPVDYETFLVKNRTVLENDAQRDMLLFPRDDLMVSFCFPCLTLLRI